MGTLWTAAKSICFATGFVTLAGWLAFSFRGYDRRWGLAPLPELGIPLGAVAMTAGAALALCSIGLFVFRGHGTPAPFDAPRQFVAVGPYQFVRNPMYVGGLTVLAGLALYVRSPAMLAFALIWFGGAHLFVLFYEEPVLRAKFGQTYEDYLRRVPRWIPRLPRQDGYRATVTRAGSNS
jgi:protein-S-isoprenylcysteine O-methyltransferase Ste14